MLLSLRFCGGGRLERIALPSDYASLKASVENAADYDTIRISGVVDVTGQVPIVVTASHLTIKGGTIRSRSPFADQYSAALVNRGHSNTFAGVIFQGPGDNQYDEIYSSRFAWCGLKNEGDSLRVDRCRFVNCQKWGLWMWRTGNSAVVGCTFTGTVGQGYGYGIWCGSTETRETVTIKGCTFNRNRVHIDGSGHLNNIVIDSCTFGRQTTFVPVQRHDRSTARTFGGLNMTVTRCTFIDSLEPLRPCIPADSSGVVTISGNRWRWPMCVDAMNAGSYFCSRPDSKVRFTGNTSFGLLPEAVKTAASDTFSFAVKSSYWQGLSPYSIEARIDSTVVYRSNASGKTSWKIFKCPLPVTAKSVSFTVKCDSTVSDSTRTELQVWVDDMAGSSFEGYRLESGWKQIINGTWSTGIRSAESYTGYHSFMIRQPYTAKITKGWSCTLIRYMK